MCYYSDELKRISTKSEFPAQVKLSDAEGNKTKFLSLNKESAKVLVEWLTTNFLEAPATLNEVIEGGKMVAEYETQDFDDTEMYLVEVYHFEDSLYYIANGAIIRRGPIKK